MKTNDYVNETDYNDCQEEEVILNTHGNQYSKEEILQIKTLLALYAEMTVEIYYQRNKQNK